MSTNEEMVANRINALKGRLFRLHKDSQEFHSNIHEIVEKMKNGDKKTWKYATLTYIKSVSYERKNKYSQLYKIVCNIEKEIMKILNTD